jgi:hypothetical protein
MTEELKNSGGEKCTVEPGICFPEEVLLQEIFSRKVLVLERLSIVELLNYYPSEHF